MRLRNAWIVLKAMEKLYSAKEIQRLFGFKARRIRYWDKIGFLSPSVKIGTRKYYTSQDLMGLRTTKALLDAGLSLAEVKRSVVDIKRVCPEEMRPHSGIFIPIGFTADVRAEGRKSRTSRQNRPGRRGLSKSKSK